MIRPLISFRYPALFLALSTLLQGNPPARPPESKPVILAENPRIPVPLFDATTTLEPATTIDTPSALITRIADRGRDRHAREDLVNGIPFQAYDHYLRFYWEHRTTTIEIVDYVAKGGTNIEVNLSSLWPLGVRDFRAFYRGLNTVAEYHYNLGPTQVGPSDSAGPNRYTTSFNRYPLEGNRPLRVGDRMEFEFSPFLLAPPNGRSNYYGTAYLYIIGEGIKPWQAVGPRLDSFPIPKEAWLGGRTTNHYQYSNEPDHLFKQMAGNMAELSAQSFMLGRRLHHTDFGTGRHSEAGNPVLAQQVGKLGPKFINRSCVACHLNNGRAMPPAVGAPMHQTVIKIGSSADGAPHPVLGSVLQPRVTTGPVEGRATIASYTILKGTYGDDTPYTLRKPNYTFTGSAPSHFSVRLTPPLVGMGLLEALDEETILALADPNDQDGDGISGAVQIVNDPKSGEWRLGRFGYKAGQARLRHQIASALNTDMGVTTSIFPILEDGAGTTGGAPELSAPELGHLERYLATLGVSPRRDLDDPKARRGLRLFTSSGCANCHLPTLTTGSFHPMTELRKQTIHPFTDLLLHDLGPDLSDNMGEHEASGAEWRTAPLWSVGLTNKVSGGPEAYLHDGRARNLEEAILWHGGESTPAKEAFRTMPAADRSALVKFLKSL